MKRCFSLQRIAAAATLFLSSAAAFANYQIPASRRTAWNAGLDPIGGIPSYSPVTTCNGLHPDGSVDDAAAINACIAAAPGGSVVALPAGIYTVGSPIRMRSGVVLRGAPRQVSIWLPEADPNATTLVLASGAAVSFSGSRTWGPELPITAGYVQGAQSVTVSDASGLSVGDYVSVYQDQDPSLPIDAKGATWLGDNCGTSACHVKQQYTRITSKNGNTIGLADPIYLVAGNPTGQTVRKQTFDMTMAGIEDLRIDGQGISTQAIYLYGALYCWVKNVETYNLIGCNGCSHINTRFSLACEIRDSHVHFGGTHNSGTSYGITFYNWNSKHKVENNIVSSTRHSIVFEGGGSGCAILYNYSYDNWEGESNSLTFGLSLNHGAHPHMNLWEGNVDQQMYADYTWGTSSHNTLFRNWAKGWRAFPSGYTWGLFAFRVGPFSRYYNLVGNVGGISEWTTGSGLCGQTDNCTSPTGFQFGYHTDGTYLDSQSFATAIVHGNYDYVTDGVNHWADDDHGISSSLYYSAKPTWYGECVWPPFGPDVEGQVNALPAELRLEGLTCASPPVSPRGLSITP